MSVGKRLNAALIIMIILIMITVVLNYMSLKNIQGNMEEALDYRVEQIRSVDKIRFNVAMQGMYVRALVFDGKEESAESFKQYNELLDQEIEYLSTLVSSDTMTEQMEQIIKYRDDFNYGYLDMMDAFERGDQILANGFINTKLRAANDGMFDATAQMVEHQEKELDAIKTKAGDAIGFSVLVAGIALAISVLIGVLVMIYIRKTIISPLNGIVNEANLIAAGDLSQQDILVKTKDEIGQLGNAFNSMKNNLSNLIKNIQVNSEQVNAAAQELSASTEEISATTEDVTVRVNDTAERAQISAHASNESARAMEETAAGVQRIAESTQKLLGNSVDATQTAKDGGQIIYDAQQQMSIISSSTNSVNALVQKLAQQTEEINNISQLITSITDQTNLLALNAAIEAARAGEHGKGFAVVADEVRKLAEQSKSSANSIVNLTLEIKADTENVERAVSDSLVSVEDGVKIIANAGESFTTIVDAVTQMSMQIQEISATSEELSASAEQVTASVNEIAQSSNESSGNLEMIAAAVEEQTATMQQVNAVAVTLSDNAQTLQQEILQFKV
ncbi:methyl-accepting chemotaxis protein [Solibacillus isronensis]|uniref:methyl-accepting chemotaxis protein n=1 Tax=Solibacillus isronensis TaxID=412383 RepID=UPI00203E52E7|nr:methyl-accepting chemotaxis protein [Solibacillus isronensis]MCM3722627.1 methyl-accepting chemotaxis protein [Solibacillus isronensis]